MEREHKKNCLHCRLCRGVYANGGFQFLGCYHYPYHGTWVAEIKECPKKAEETNLPKASEDVYKGGVF